MANQMQAIIQANPLTEFQKVFVFWGDNFQQYSAQLTILHDYDNYPAEILTFSLFTALDYLGTL